MNGRQLRVILHTQEYPTSNSPCDGLFTQQLADVLAEHVPLDVVRPVAWPPLPAWIRKRTDRLSLRGVPQRATRGPQRLFFPRVPSIPLVTRRTQPALQAHFSLGVYKQIVSGAEPCIVNAHSVYPDGVAAHYLARRLGLPLVLTAIGSDINALGDDPRRIAQVRAALYASSRVVAVSRALRDSITALAPGSRVIHIPNGVDRNRFHVEQKANRALAPSRPLVLFVGRLHAVKAVDVLLSSLAMIRDERGHLPFQTVIAGDGPERIPLARQHRELRLGPDVCFIGALSHEEIPTWMQRATALCLPSHNEGSPNVVIEALACGTPVVATAVGGLPDLVTTQSGELVPPSDPRALASALLRVVSRKWDREQITKQLVWADWRRSAAQYMAIFRELAVTS